MLVPSKEATPEKVWDPLAVNGGMTVYCRVRGVASKNGPHFTRLFTASHVPEAEILDTVQPAGGASCTA